MREVISTDKGPKAIGPYSQAIKANGFIFISGQGAGDPATGRVVDGGIAEQTARCLENLKAIVEAAGSSLEHAVRVGVFLRDINDFEAMNQVYALYFSANPPARTTIEAARLPRDFRVEIVYDRTCLASFTRRTDRMTEDTKIGGASGRFPATHWSAVLAARSDDSVERSRALEAIAAAYWKPIYKYVRIRWGKSNEDAKDLTQDFFAKLFEKEYLDAFDPAKARLRTFLRICADRFIANEAKAAKRLKRGGGAAHLSLDFDAAENELQRASPHLQLAASSESMDDFLEKEFIRSLFGIAVDKLRSECESRGKQIHFRLFELYDLEGDDARKASYAELAIEFQIAPTDVTNYLALARREFRRIALDCLREMTVSEDEFRREARALLGVVPA